jgi:hypothetical protein
VVTRLRTASEPIMLEALKAGKLKIVGARYDLDDGSSCGSRIIGYYGTWPRSGFLTSGRSWDQTLTRFISGS